MRPRDHTVGEWIVVGEWYHRQNGNLQWHVPRIAEAVFERQGIFRVNRVVDTKIALIVVRGRRTGSLIIASKQSSRAKAHDWEEEIPRDGSGDS